MTRCRGVAALRGRLFDKCSQLFIRTHNETLSVAAMCVRNKDCSPGRIESCNTAPTSTVFAEIVSDDFPIFHVMSSAGPFRRTAWLSFTVLSARAKRQSSRSAGRRVVDPSAGAGAARHSLKNREASLLWLAVRRQGPSRRSTHK